jgi:hypothetical protein
MNNINGAIIAARKSVVRNLSAAEQSAALFSFPFGAT